MNLQFFDWLFHTFPMLSDHQNAVLVVSLLITAFVLGYATCFVHERIETRLFGQRVIKE